jgi:hypothetical protein
MLGYGHLNYPSASLRESIRSARARNPTYKTVHRSPFTTLSFTASPRLPLSASPLRRLQLPRLGTLLIVLIQRIAP